MLGFEPGHTGGRRVLSPLRQQCSPLICPPHEKVWSIKLEINSPHLSWSVSSDNSWIIHEVITWGIKSRNTILISKEKNYQGLLVGRNYIQTLSWKKLHADTSMVVTLTVPVLWLYPLFGVWILGELLSDAVWTIWTNPWLAGTWEQSNTFTSSSLDRELTTRLLEKIWTYRVPVCTFHG